MSQIKNKIKNQILLLFLLGLNQLVDAISSQNVNVSFSLKIQESLKFSQELQDHVAKNKKIVDTKVAADVKIIQPILKLKDPLSVPGVDVNIPLSEDKIIEYLDYKLTEIKASKDINSAVYARSVKRYSYTELAAIIEKAERLAEKDATHKVTMQHLENAEKDIRAGEVDEWFLKYSSKEYNRATTLHEAAHAVANIYVNSKYKIVHHVTILPRSKTAGTTKSNLIVAKSGYDLIEYENDIVALLCGGVAEQYFGLPESFKGKNLIKYLSDDGCSSDFAAAKSTAESIVVMESFKLPGEEYKKFIGDTKDEALLQQEVDKVIAKCYDLAWDFVVEHKDEINDVANLLLEKYTISGDDVYRIVKKDKPLYDFEEGPLPLSLLPNYELRGLYDIKN